MRLRKKLVVALLVACFAGSSFAFIQFLWPVTTAVLWLGRLAGANVVRARFTEWVLIGHGALVYYSWEGPSTSTEPASAPPKAMTVVQISPAAKRDNPDPKRYDDASSGRNPTPKPSYAGEADQNYASAPATGTLVAGMPAGATWTMAVSNASSWTTYMTVAISGYAGASDSQKCASAQAATVSSNPSGWAWTCVAGISSDSKTVGLWYKTTTGKVCASGYVQSGGNCILQDASAVMKPAAAVPCEVIKNADGTWDIDPTNPSCVDQQQKMLTIGKKLSIGKDDGNYDEFETTSDGGTKITSGNRQMDLGPPGSDGGSPIRGITDFGSGASGGGTSSGGSGSTGGTGGTGGTGSCGGTSQVPCSVTVDDGSFDGKDGPIGTAADTVGAKRDEYNDAVLSEANKTGETFGLSTSWIPSLLPGTPVACQNLRWEPAVSHGPLSGLVGSEEVDWCSKIDVFREYYAWLVGVVTVFAIAMLFFSSNGSAGRPER
jgi:hypothetical protein